jgi:integrase
MLGKLDYYIKSKRHAKSTYSGHMGRAKIIFDIREKWERDEAERWIYQRAENKDYSESTINKWFQTFNTLNQCFEWGWEKGFSRIKENNKSPEQLSLDELLRFYHLHTKDKYDLIIKLAITTGARPSEILTLQRQEVDMERQVITLNHTKTKNNRILMIQDFLMGDLVAFFNANDFKRGDYIFHYNTRKKPLDIASLGKEFRTRLKILDIEKNITPYCMRHAYLTRMASKVNIAILKEMAGHRRITTTERYIHNNEFVLREASEQDFLFDDLRDFSKKMKRIVKLINELGESKTVNQVKLSEAVFCLQQAVSKEMR